MSCNRDHKLNKIGGYNYCSSRGERLKNLCPSTTTPCSAWLPITTAPNSLTQIIITDGSSAWVDQKLGKKADEEAGDYYFNGHENWEEVTHWMPIPSLPNVERCHQLMSEAKVETITATPTRDEAHVPCNKLHDALIELRRERDAALAVIEAIEERYVDGCDTYEDWKFMGEIARDFLSGEGEDNPPQQFHVQRYNPIDGWITCVVYDTKAPAEELARHLAESSGQDKNNWRAHPVNKED